MSDEKKNILSSFSAGNLITAGIIMVGIISTWAKIGFHISDNTIHLTEDQRNNLTKFTTIVDDKLPTIKINRENLIQINENFAVFIVKFNNLNNEHNDLEDKVSRVYKELNNEIKTLHE